MAKRSFWQPTGGGYNVFYAEYRSREDPTIKLWKRCSSGKEREEFIREQSLIIRRFETEKEYLDFYNFLSTLVA